MAFANAAPQAVIFLGLYIQQIATVRAKIRRD